MNDTYSALCCHVRETATLASVQSLLGWDERTLMPTAGGKHRAEQMKLLAGMIHQRSVDPRIGQWLSELAGSDLAADPHSDAGATIRLVQREYDKKRKLPQELVVALTEATVVGQQQWDAARRAKDFAAFLPALTRIVELKREEADALGYEESIYDPLLDDYEPGEKTSNVKRVLAGLRDELAPLIAEIAASDRKPNEAILKREYPVAGQEKFGKLAAAAIGFDFGRGRLDVTHHPFCCDVGPDDCRITTRYDAHFFPSAFYSILHEAGHGIYEQGLRGGQFGLPPGLACSLGIHESQSRLGENALGRSREFWQHFLPAAQEEFSALADVALDELYFAVNTVKPSLIRVEADEATYNLHIIVRFELEQALLSGKLSPAGLPEAWREKYQSYLGIEPDNDAEGCMQDVHWGAGLFGYFPTYSLGNLYAAQFYEQADADLGGLAAQFARGEFAPLREWLGEKIHRHGQCYSAAELVERVTGKPLSHEPLMRYLKGKLEPLYGI